MGTQMVSNYSNEMNDKLILMRDGKYCLVKVSIVLQIQSSKETGACAYKNLMLTVVTASRHHPDHGCPYKIKDVTLTYNSNKKMVVLQAPYIESGIYEVVPKAELRPHPGFKNSSLQQAQLISVDSIDDIPKGSTCIIIGGIHQIPTNIELEPFCDQGKIMKEFVGSKTFRKFTLPILLAHGEPNVWASIPGCQDVQPVFLTPKLNYDSWKWCQGIHIPVMNPTPIFKNIPIEPSNISENIPFCEFIYHTYIAGTPYKSNEYDESEGQIPVTEQSSNTKVVNIVTAEPQFKRPSLLPKKSLLKIQNARASKNFSLEKRPFKMKPRDKRLLLNVHSLCGSSSPVNQRNVPDNGVSETH